MRFRFANCENNRLICKRQRIKRKEDGKDKGHRNRLSFRGDYAADYKVV